MSTHPTDPPDVVAGPAGGLHNDGLTRRVEREAEGPDRGDAAAIERGRARTRPSSTRNVVEWIAVIVGAIVIAVVVRTFLVQTFWIPSPSMAETLIEGDRVLVNKLSYRFGDVNRGDVVVFERPPSDPVGETKDLIKRVVGLPGERVSIVDGEVLIDGRLLDEPYVDGAATVADGACLQAGVELPGLGTPDGFVVPEGQVLVLGDNRTNSQDGRCFGPIDEDLIIGRAFVIIWPPSRAGGL